MPKVKSVQQNADHSSYYDVVDTEGKNVEGVEVFHTYKTFATAVVLITTAGDCELTAQQQDGIARRIDGRFRLNGAGVEINPTEPNKLFRRYTFPQN